MNKESKISKEVLSAYPNEIDSRNPKFIKFDNKYVSSLIVIGYNKEMEETFLDRILSQDINLQLSIFYEKQNHYPLKRPVDRRLHDRARRKRRHHGHGAGCLRQGDWRGGLFSQKCA